jgi:hypothetical protein
MVLAILAVACIPILYYPCFLVFQFLECLRTARCMNVPFFCMPILQDGMIWQLTKRWHRPLISRLPFGLSQWPWFDLWYPDWRFVAKHRLHEEHGDVFLVVSPGCISVEIADARIAAEVIDRSRHDFVKPAWPYCKSCPYSSDSHDHRQEGLTDRRFPTQLC